MLKLFQPCAAPGTGPRKIEATGRPEDATLWGLFASRVPVMLAPKMEARLGLFLEFPRPFKVADMLWLGR